MRGHLKLITPPAIEPVTLEEACNQCKQSVGVDDVTIRGLIIAARKACEDVQWKAYTNQTFELSFDLLPAMPVWLPRPPLVSVVSVKLYDRNNAEIEISLSDLFIDNSSEPARISFNYGKTWPAIELRELSAVKIRYIAGYGSELNDDLKEKLADVRSAMLLWIAHMYDNAAGESGKMADTFKNILIPNKMYQ
jgi:uncharacterized phiE125 gp8 family phage protein